MEGIINVRKDLLIAPHDLKLTTQIGEGAYGQVWKGTFGIVDIAVKKILLQRTTPQISSTISSFIAMTKKILQGIEQEIDSLATLHHPHILQIYGVCVCSPTEFWIVMEFADGGSLYSLLSDPSVDIPWDYRWRWIQEVTAAISFLHKRNLIHRDLKSPNFLIVKDSIKLCDFGMAKTASLSSIKSTGHNVGTARWLAPESIGRDAAFDKKSDVYGMGMVIWEIITREIPFKDILQDGSVIALVKYEELRPDIPSFCPRGVATEIMRCWDQNPDARPSADEVTSIIRDQRTRFTAVEHISTIAGTVNGFKDGVGKEARFGFPSGMCFNPFDECLYICDYRSNTLRKATLQGEVSTFVPSGKLMRPYSIAMNYKEKCFYITNSYSGVSKITLEGEVSMFADNAALKKVSGMDHISLCGITIDQQSGNVFVSNTTSNNGVIQITPTGEVTLLAGSSSGYKDGKGAEAEFRLRGIYFDDFSQSIIVSDFDNSKLRRVKLNGEVTTLCDVKRPTNVVMTDNRTLFIASASPHLYKAVLIGDDKYAAVVVAGTGVSAQDDGKADECTFEATHGIVVHEPSHSLYVTDTDCLRVVSFANH